MSTTKRPPVVVVMGHIDHGKSTLLDYIRKSNIVAGEAGGITQHLSAYEIVHKDETGENRRITFIDTPGHAAFSGMRERGAQIADIAILVVSAEDSVKAQTIEAWETITLAKIPYVVAINKIDRPEANIEKVKNDLIEKGIYLEGYGGDVPFAEISAKIGTNIDQLLDLIILATDLNELKTDPTTEPIGIVIESHRDPKRGVIATLIVKDGVLQKGCFVATDSAYAPTRIMENFLGKPIATAPCSTPVTITGFSELPQVGSFVTVFDSKKDAEKYIFDEKMKTHSTAQVQTTQHNSEIKIIPLIIKTDAGGTQDAIKKELSQLEQDTVKFKFVTEEVGAISEKDIRLAETDPEIIIIGFNVDIDPKARALNEQVKATIINHPIIYKISDDLKLIVEERRPRITEVRTSGTLKVIKTFSQTKDKQVLGCRITDGLISLGNTVRIMRRDNEIGRGKITELQHNRVKQKSLEAPIECGIMVETRHEIIENDYLEAITEVVV
jgi:translation initiation factor IF-2